MQSSPGSGPHLLAVDADHEVALLEPGLLGVGEYPDSPQLRRQELAGWYI